MGKSNVLEVHGRDTIVDPLTELLWTDVERLIYQAVEEELQELFVYQYNGTLYNAARDYQT